MQDGWMDMGWMEVGCMQGGYGMNGGGPHGCQCPDAGGMDEYRMDGYRMDGCGMGLVPVPGAGGSAAAGVSHDAEGGAGGVAHGGGDGGVLLPLLRALRGPGHVHGEQPRARHRPAPRHHPSLLLQELLRLQPHHLLLHEQTGDTRGHGHHGAQQRHPGTSRETWVVRTAQDIWTMGTPWGTGMLGTSTQEYLGTRDIMGYKDDGNI